MRRTNYSSEIRKVKVFLKKVKEDTIKPKEARVRSLSGFLTQKDPFDFIKIKFNRGKTLIKYRVFSYAVIARFFNQEKEG